MRLDYVLYVVAIIFFIATLTVLAYPQDSQQLWIVTTTVLGLLFIGLGYTQRPKTRAATKVTSPTPTMPEVKEEKTETIEVAPTLMPQVSELTKVKGIGEKRSEQLKALGINTVDDLAKASAEDLALKLKVSPKITSKWISEAKKLTEKS